MDLCVITADKTDYHRGYEQIAGKGPRSRDYWYRRGTTGVLETSVRRFEVVSESVSGVESMDM